MTVKEYPTSIMHEYTLSDIHKILLEKLGNPTAKNFITTVSNENGIVTGLIVVIKKGEKS